VDLDPLDQPDRDNYLGGNVVFPRSLLLVRDDGDESEAGLRQHAVEAKTRAVPELHLDRRLLDLALAREPLDMAVQALHEVFMWARETGEPELRHAARVLWTVGLVGGGSEGACRLSPQL
jgi:hypothetical protein